MADLQGLHLPERLTALEKRQDYLAEVVGILLRDKRVTLAFPIAGVYIPFEERKIWHDL